MVLHELQKQIVAKQLDKLYIFTGQEVGIMDIYLKKLLDIIGGTTVRPDSVLEAYNKMSQRRISGGSRCFIVRDDKEFLKQEKLWDKFFLGINSSPDYIILIYSTMDKRSKFYKSQTDKLTEFAKLTEAILVKYIQKEIRLSAKNATELAVICECDYSRVLLECDKINQFSIGTDNTHDASYELLKSEGAIYQPIGDITFKFTDAIALRDYKATARYLMQAKQKQEPEIMVLSVLYNSFKQMLLVQGLGPNATDAAKRTGLTPWQVKLANEKKGHYTLSELISAIKVIRFAEKSIKIGQLDADVALEYVIVNIM